MPTFMMLANITDAAFNTIEESAQRLTQFRAICNEMGVKVLSYYFLMGPYDIVTFLEAPDHNTMAKLAVVAGKRGNVRTQTYCTIDENTFAELASHA